MLFSALITLSVASLGYALPQNQQQSGAGGGPDAAYSSLISKYSTVSGFSQFSSGLQAQLMGYVMTQTFVQDQAELAKATDPAVVATNPALQSMGMEINTMINQYLAADTNLAPSAKQSLASDLASIMSQTAAPAPTDASTPSNAPAPAGTASGAPEPTGTGESETEASGAPSDVPGESESGAGDDVPSPTAAPAPSGSEAAAPTDSAPADQASNAPSPSGSDVPSPSDSSTPTDTGAASSASPADLAQQTTNEANRLGMLSLSGVAAGMVAVLAIAL
ncbi:hypothetical protein BZA77DRAFT_175848 [Pyronema omphalodes]|nr:hypothetical protein BZA77DRAFT_175848 [Pyronema omphalodes]